MKILLVTGPSGDIQGWGDDATAQLVANALLDNRIECSVLYTDDLAELQTALERGSYHMVWSSLYFFTGRSTLIGYLPDLPWVQDILESKNIPYIGSGATSMRLMLDKRQTTRILAKKGVSVPWQYVIEYKDALPDIEFPALVKPRFESESSGVSEESVVETRSQLQRQLEYIHHTFNQSALVEEYLPGREFTVSMLGNGCERTFYPVENIINDGGYARFPIVTKKSKLDGVLDLDVPQTPIAATLTALAASAVNALQCADHVRIDMREDRHGTVKVIEINGIPGLDPAKSRSLLIHQLYNQDLSIEQTFKDFIARIVEAASARYGLTTQLIPTLDRERV